MKQENIIYIRLTSGDEIIGEALEDNNTQQFVINKPTLVFLQPTQGGSYEAQFFPYMPLKSEDVVMISASSVQGITTPNEDTVENYLKFIGEKVIATPTNKIVVPK